MRYSWLPKGGYEIHIIAREGIWDTHHRPRRDMIFFASLRRNMSLCQATSNQSARGILFKYRIMLITKWACRGSKEISLLALTMANRWQYIHQRLNLYLFSSVISRANTWLHQNPDARVISCETVQVEGVYSLEDDDSHSTISDIFEDKRYQAFLTVFRWVINLI